MIQARDVRRNVDAVIERQIPLRALEEWLTDASSNFGDYSNEAIDLIASVQWVIAQYEDEAFSGDALRRELRIFVPHTSSDSAVHR